MGRAGKRVSRQEAGDSLTLLAVCGLNCHYDRLRLCEKLAAEDTALAADARVTSERSPRHLQQSI